MKILNLKFKNINSLSGENEIDFTNPVFTNDGLFAITGKTGAGKSSILDAISLAFYGKTPRVDITGNENAVMTRGEKDCYSEIVFEVSGKKWKSSWKQERARTGTLKQVERVIADENDKIVADKISIKGERANAEDKTVGEKIVEILGLTFEQFTKVIMLAQGSFAAFLQAKNDEKGELLEQITGTEIYAEISKKVFERNKTENEKLKKIVIELEAIKVLSEEEIENLTVEVSVIEKDKNQIDADILKLEVSKKWLSDIQGLHSQINEAKQKLPKLLETEKIAKELLEKAESALKKAKEEQEKQEPIFKKVREFDTKISEKEILLQPILNGISELEKSKRELSQTLENQNDKLKNSQTSLTEKQNWETENKKYEVLVSSYTAIENESKLLVNSSNEIEKLNSELVGLQTDFDLKQTNANKATVIFNENNEKYALKIKELETKKSELAQILGGKELSKLQSEKENISNFSIQIQNLIELENTISTSQKEIENIDEKLKQFENVKTELSIKIETQKKTITNLENQINLLDENIKLTKTIQSLDEHRHNLKDGEECPLCGSLEHPFAKGNIPKIGEKEKELASLKIELKDATKTVHQNEKNLTVLVSDNGNALKNKEKEAKSLSDNSTKQKVILSEIQGIKSTFSIPKGEKKIERLEEILEKTKEELKSISSLILKASAVEAALINVRDKEIPLLQEEKQKVEKLKNDADTAKKLAEQQLKTKKDSATSSLEKYKTENASFLKKLKIFSVENIDELKNCLNLWNDNKKQKEGLSLQITTLGSDIAVNKKELDGQTKLCSEKQIEKQNIETDKLKLLNGRIEIFAERIVEVEENLLKKLLEDSEAKKSKAEKEKNEANTELEKNKAIVTEKEKEFLKLQELKITVKTKEELQTELDEKKIKAEEFSQKIGANNQKLKSNAENLITSGSKLKEKEKQKANCDEWGTLNELIGSGDGKKYRNFAQALTFEHLIGLSNKQLQKMSDRYILKRTGDSSNPFELSVIDKFQNSEERTALNLSGGEKFIASLSLALGLANMASKNMSIDTMFIDEGFGTLDSDSLDVALNALSNLQSEGKVIGVISHLTEVKERIATHVEVVSGGNGHSSIQIIH
jgi:exonuclease SbcC